MARKSRKRTSPKAKRSATQKPRKAKRTKRNKLVRPKRYNPRLEDGVKILRETKSLAEAARKIGVPPGVLRRYALGTGTIERRDGKWLLKRDRRFRRMPMYSSGQRELVMVHNGNTASLIGSYMRAVKLFLETEDLSLLKRFEGQSVPDVQGKRHTFETRPNVILRLDASGIEPFELAYEIVKQS